MEITWENDYKTKLFAGFLQFWHGDGAVLLADPKAERLTLKQLNQQTVHVTPFVLPVHAVFDDGGAFVVHEAIVNARASLLGNAANA